MLGGKSIVHRRILVSVLGAVTFAIIFCGQSSAEDVQAVPAPSQETQTTQPLKHPAIIAPESTAPILQPTMKPIVRSLEKRSGPKIKLIRGQRPKGPDRAKVTIVGRPNQQTRIVGEDGQVEWLIWRPILVSPSASPSMQPKRHPNRYEQADKRRKLRKKLEIQSSRRSATISGAVRPRVTPSPPPARRRSPKSPQRPTAPVQETAEH